ncbi:MAG: Ig-like domain-containing protein [Atopobiaceae bacterium]|nr:Ig-like domain-containing protein [Atopobiaceae bacterium]
MAQMFGWGLPRRLLGLTLGASVALGAAPGIAARAALAQEDAGSAYEVEIPATVEVAKAGWNATAGISAQGSLAPGKKLAVTAASTNGWALKSGQNGVEYKLAESGDASTTYAGAAEKTSWEFATLSADAQTQPMGVVVDDYASAAPGDYADTVTFTVAVEDAAQSASIGYKTASVTRATAQGAFTNPLDNTGDGTVEYKSSDASVAEVDPSTGEVTPVGLGKCTITATVTDSASHTYAEKTASYELDVKKAVVVKGEYYYYEDGDTWQTLIDGGKYRLESTFIVGPNVEVVTRGGHYGDWLCHGTMDSDYLVYPSDAVDKYTDYVWW